MRTPGRSPFFLAAALALFASGCAAVHREEYSLAIRKPAHRYRPYSDADVRAMAAIHQAMEADPPAATPNAAPEAWGSGPSLSNSELIRSEYLVAGRLEAFRPFAYCYLHETCHVPESVAAIGAVPVEYPLAVGTTLTVVIVDSAVRYLGEIWEAIFPSQPDKTAPFPPPDRSRDRKK